MSITFQYPYATPILTLTLRNPELGDSEGLDIKTQFQITMNGDVHSHRRTPENKKLLMTFRNITKSLTLDLRNFIKISSGSEIKYTDYNSVIWRGYIINNPIESATESKIVDGTCIEVSTFTLEFNGSIA